MSLTKRMRFKQTRIKVMAADCDYSWGSGLFKSAQSFFDPSVTTNE